MGSIDQSGRLFSRQKAGAGCIGLLESFDPPPSGICGDVAIPESLVQCRSQGRPNAVDRCLPRTLALRAHGSGAIVLFGAGPRPQQGRLFGQCVPPLGQLVRCR